MGLSVTASGYRSVPDGDIARYPKVVDLWAARLDLKGIYEWLLRSE
jgi:hypothetical protein